MKIFKRAACAALAGCFACTPAIAATISLMGDTITYVYDDVANATALALFGTPTIEGDVVRFLPPSFRAESIDGVGTTSGLSTDVVGVTFVFAQVFSNTDSAIADITLTEFGDYRIDNDGDVTLDLELTAENNDNLAEFVSDNASIAVQGDTGGLQQWLRMASVSPSNLPGMPNSVRLSIDNILTATTTSSGELAFIQKKFTVVATVVPIPGAIWLFGSALGLFALGRRRRSID